MKRNIFTLLCFSMTLAAFLMFVDSTSADYRTDLVKQLGSAAAEQDLAIIQSKDPRDVIAAIIRNGLTFVGTLFVLTIVYAGILMFTSGGEEEKVTKAKNILKISTLGLVIVLSAYSITVFVTQVLLRDPNLDTQLIEKYDTDANIRHEDAELQAIEKETREFLQNQFNTNRSEL